jgi:hypothetical protein
MPGNSKQTVIIHMKYINEKQLEKTLILQHNQTLHWLYSNSTFKRAGISYKKARWVGHILHRNCLLQHAEDKIEGQIEVMRRWGRRYKQLMDDVKEMRGHWMLKEEALDRIQWGTRLSKRTWTCCKTDYSMHMLKYPVVYSVQNRKRWSKSPYYNAVGCHVIYISDVQGNNDYILECKAKWLDCTASDTRIPLIHYAAFLLSMTSALQLLLVGEGFPCHTASALLQATKETVHYFPLGFWLSFTKMEACVQYSNKGSHIRSNTAQNRVTMNN